MSAPRLRGSSVSRPPYLAQSVHFFALLNVQLEPQLAKIELKTRQFPSLFSMARVKAWPFPGLRNETRHPLGTTGGRATVR
jgi:hypothetical protein